MFMIHRHFISVGLLCLVSCAAYCDQASSPTLTKEAQEQATDAWRDHRLAYGKEIYEQACASCHDEGTDGTPAIGDRQAWSERSPLWSAVLFEHSKDGYLDMPAKGSHQELTDQAVDAASEYLLSVTYPELPLD
jgi:cytochrome c5